MSHEYSHSPEPQPKYLARRLMAAGAAALAVFGIAKGIETITHVEPIASATAVIPHRDVENGKISIYEPTYDTICNTATTLVEATTLPKGTDKAEIIQTCDSAAERLLDSGIDVTGSEVIVTLQRDSFTNYSIFAELPADDYS